MAYTYTTGQGPAALDIDEPAPGDSVSTGDEALRQIKALLADETWFKYNTNRGTLVFNEAGADIDVRLEGASDENLLFLDASANRIGIGTNSPGALLDVAGDVIVGDGTTSTGLMLDTGGFGANTISFRTDGVVRARIEHVNNLRTFKVYVGGNTEALLINEGGKVTFSAMSGDEMRLEESYNTGTTAGAEDGYIIVALGSATRRIKTYANS